MNEEGENGIKWLSVIRHNSEEKDLQVLLHRVRGRQ